MENELEGGKNRRRGEVNIYRQDDHLDDLDVLLDDNPLKQQNDDFYAQLDYDELEPYTEFALDPMDEEAKNIRRDQEKGESPIDLYGHMGMVMEKKSSNSTRDSNSSRHRNAKKNKLEASCDDALRIKRKYVKRVHPKVRDYSLRARANSGENKPAQEALHKQPELQQLKQTNRKLSTDTSEDSSFNNWIDEVDDEEKEFDCLYGPKYE